MHPVLGLIDDEMVIAQIPHALKTLGPSFLGLFCNFIRLPPIPTEVVPQTH